MKFVIWHESRENHVEEIEDDERGKNDSQHSSQSFFKRFKIVRNNRQMIFHEAGKSQRECLSANNDVPTHHEDTEENQNAGDNRASGCQARPQQH